MEKLRQELFREKAKLLETMSEGDVRKGRVTSLADFGVFVDINGIEGLIHLSELSWTRISHPREILKVGDEIDVYILHIDPEQQRVALSLKRLQPEPWSQILNNYEINQIVDGVITKLTNFGAFARIDDRIEGLIHISEISEKNITHPREVLAEGQKVRLRIIHIDAERRRMGLSMRQVAEQQDWALYSTPQVKPNVPDDTVNIILTSSIDKSLPQKITPADLADNIVPYLKAIASFQALINEIKGYLPQEVGILSIKKGSINVTLSAATQAIELIMSVIVPWRYKHAKTMAQLAESEKLVQIESAKADILAKRIQVNREREDKERTTIELTRQRAEVEKLQLENAKLRLELHRGKIQLALDILDRINPNLTEVAKIDYVTKLLGPIEVLISTDLEPQLVDPTTRDG